MSGKIIITKDFEGLKDELIAEFGEKNLRFIVPKEAGEFLMDNARAVEKESFIAENSEKIIVLMAQSYKNEAQNFLLKLFEEPPKNVRFILVAPSKNLLLATVRSRFIMEVRKGKKQRASLNLALQSLDLKEMLNFLKANENLDKVALMELVAALSIKAGASLNLSEEKLELFYKAYELSRLNARPSLLLSALLLNLYERD